MPVLTLDSGSQPLFQPGDAGSVTVINLSATATVYVAATPVVHDTDIPIGPLASITFDGSRWWYGSALNATAQVAVGPGVTGYFLPASLANIGGSKIYIQAGAPSGAIPLNSVWFDTGNGSLQTWNGNAWVNEQFSAQNLIQAATILGTQIAAQTVTAGNVANGTLTTAQLAAAAGILGTQIAAATVTGANIAAHTIAAENIAANTITAAQLAAGIIYAGIVNGTTISGAIFNATDTNGSINIDGSQITWSNGAFMSIPSAGGRLIIGGNPGVNVVDVMLPFSSILTTVQPGTAATTESWHLMALSAGFAAGAPAPQYRLYPDGTMHLTGSVTLTAAQAAGASMTLLPGSYIPQTIQRFNVPNTLSGGAAGARVLYANTTGNIGIDVAGSNGNTVDLDGVMIALDA